MLLEDRGEKATYRILPIGSREARSLNEALNCEGCMSVDAVHCFLALRPVASRRMSECAQLESRASKRKKARLQVSTGGLIEDRKEESKMKRRGGVYRCC